MGGCSILKKNCLPGGEGYPLYPTPTRMAEVNFKKKLIGGAGIGEGEAQITGR